MLILRAVLGRGREVLAMSKAKATSKEMKLLAGFVEKRRKREDEKMLIRSSPPFGIGGAISIEWSEADNDGKNVSVGEDKWLSGSAGAIGGGQGGTVTSIPRNAAQGARITWGFRPCERKIAENRGSAENDTLHKVQPTRM